jgi:hypothetical protein
LIILLLKLASTMYAAIPTRERRIKRIFIMCIV